MTMYRLSFCASLCLLLTGLVLTAPASAEDDYLLSERTYKMLNAIHELLADNQQEQALRRCQALVEGLPDKGYDKAMALQTLGYIQIRLERYADAAETFIAALKLDALPEDVTHQLRLNAGQMLIQENRLKEGVAYLEQWLRNEKQPDNNSRLMLASAYYQLKRYGEAVEQLQALLKSGKASEDWYRLLLACYLEQKHYKSASSLLERMLALYPDREEYWHQLTALYQQQKQDKKSLALLELMLARGYLDDEAQFRLARSYLYHEMPWKSARLLQTLLNEKRIEQSADNYRLLADAWQLARETEAARDALQQAAKTGQQGQLYFRLGQVLHQLEQWPEAINALQRALELGQVEEPARARLLLGIALFNSNQMQQSEQVLRQAAGDESVKSQVRWWLQRVQEKREETG